MRNLQNSWFSPGSITVLKLRRMGRGDLISQGEISYEQNPYRNLKKIILLVTI
jgi:hypothetical protein